MLEYAFVLKNFTPIYNRVQIFHSKHGKITCMYPRTHQARLLSSGSLVLCKIDTVYNRFAFSELDIVYAPIIHNVEELEFIHQMMMICLKFLPENIQVEEVFDFLLDVYRNNKNLSFETKKLILLRIFFLTETFENTSQLYQLAMQNPFKNYSFNSYLVGKYLEVGFHKLSQEKK